MKLWFTENLKEFSFSEYELSLRGSIVQTSNSLHRQQLATNVGFNSFLSPVPISKALTLIGSEITHRLQQKEEEEEKQGPHFRLEDSVIEATNLIRRHGKDITVPISDLSADMTGKRLRRSSATFPPDELSDDRSFKRKK